MSDIFKNAPVLPYLWTSKLDYIEWSHDDTVDIGIGAFEDMTVEIELSNKKVDNYIGLELSFKSNYDLTDYSIDMMKSSIIVGIITNAVVSRINDHYWDFLCSKNSWFFRQIMYRIYREHCLKYINDDFKQIICRNNIDIDKVMN